MTTEKELKDQCTPDIIKKMCELTEGFKYFDSGKRFQFERKLYNIDDAIAFPLLIHRAVEEWNNKEIRADNYLKLRSINIYNAGACLEDKYKKPLKTYLFENYQIQNLTHAECAMLHCLLYIFNNL